MSLFQSNDHKNGPIKGETRINSCTQAWEEGKKGRREGRRGR
jgi:hypothetical protein